MGSGGRGQEGAKQQLKAVLDSGTAASRPAMLLYYYYYFVDGQRKLDDFVEKK